MRLDAAALSTVTRAAAKQRVYKAELEAANARARALVAEAEARAVKAEASARIEKAVAEADARAQKAEAEADARAQRAEADARAQKAEAGADARAQKAEAGADARAQKAEAEARAQMAEAKASVLVTKAEARCSCVLLGHAQPHAPDALLEAQGDVFAMRISLQQTNDQLLTLLQKRNVRGAVGACAHIPSHPALTWPRCWPVAEVISERARDALRADRISVPFGVQEVLDVAAQRDSNLRAVVELLCERAQVRVADALRSVGRLYHTLSKEFHGVGGEVIIREKDFTAPAERLALCAVLEAYSFPYVYEHADLGRVQSPYALAAADLLALRSRGCAGGDGNGG